MLNERCIITLVSIHSNSGLEILPVLLPDMRFKVLSCVKIGGKAPFIEAKIIAESFYLRMFDDLFLFLRL